jgi:hypothetical protein
MRCKWLVAFVILLILLMWTSVIAGPKGAGYGDDDIPELMRSRRPVTAGKVSERVDVEFFWDAVLRVEQEKEPELSKEQEDDSVRRPAARRYPVRWK